MRLVCVFSRKPFINARFYAIINQLIQIKGVYYDNLLWKTIQDAVEQGLAALSLTSDQVEVNVIQQPKNGFLGIGRKPAKVELTQKNKQEQIKPNNQPQPTDEEVGAAPSEAEDSSIDLEDVSQKLANYLNDVLVAMGFSFKLKLDLKSKHAIYIDIDTDQESRLIGRHGRTINALQNLSQILLTVSEPTTSPLNWIPQTIAHVEASH